MQAQPLFPVPTPHPHARTPRRERVLFRRRIGRALGGGALLMALLANVPVLLGDPYFLTLPCAAAAVTLAQRVLYRYNERQPAALIGNAMGLCALMLWLIIELVVRRLIGFDFSLLNTLQHIWAK